MRRSGNTVKETVYTQFFCLQVGGGGGWIDTKFWFGGIMPKRLFTNVPLPVNKWGG